MTITPRPEVSAPFTESDKADVSPPLWKDPENIAYLRELLKYLIIAGIIFALYAKVIKPSLDTMFPPPPEPEEATLPEEIAARMPGVHTIFLTDRVQVDRVRDLVVAGNDAQMADPAFMAELKA